MLKAYRKGFGKACEHEDFRSDLSKIWNPWASLNCCLHNLYTNSLFLAITNGEAEFQHKIIQIAVVDFPLSSVKAFFFLRFVTMKQSQNQLPLRATTEA